MSSNTCRIGAIYETEGQARLDFEAIVDLALEHPEITLVEPDVTYGDNGSIQIARHRIDQLIRDALPGASKGAGAGAGIGGLGTALLAAHSPALFVSAPILSGLAIAALGASIGGAVGAGIALQMRKDSLDAALDAASRSGHWCLVIHTRHADDHNTVLEFLSGRPGVQVEDGK